MAWPVSGRWDAHRRAGGRITVRADVWHEGVFTGRSLSVVGGSIRVSESSQVRRAGTVVCSDADLMPTDAAGLLSPTQADLHVWVGHTYLQGDTEAVPVGVLRVEKPRRASLFGPLELEVHDYAGVLSQSRFPAPWVVAAGVPVRDEIARIVQSVLPWVEVIDLIGSPLTTGADVRDGVVWDTVWDLATAMGGEAVFDQSGRLLLRPVPDGSSASVWTCDTDTPTANVLDAGVALDLRGVYNAVRVRCSNPTYAGLGGGRILYEGPLRWRPGFHRLRGFASPILRTLDALTAAGRTVLARSQAYAVEVSPTTLPDPRLDAGDTVTLAIRGVPTGPRILAGFEISLDPNSQRMPVTLRSPLSGVAVSTDLQEE